MREGIDCKGVAWKEDMRPIDKRWDIAGQQFKDLTALFKVFIERKKTSAAWLCRCNCGNELVAYACSLRSGHTGSCGCSTYKRVSQALEKELKAGGRFGRYTVLYKEDKTGQGGIYRCRCDCGTEKSIPRQRLITGAVVSCGCYNREEVSKRTIIDLTGQRFGKLLILGRSNRKVIADVYWNFKCDCGITGEVSGHNLRRGTATSCGCSNMSQGEQIISKILLENNVNFIYNRAYFDDLKSDIGKPLRYDFILLKDNKPYRIIEFDGAQHFVGDIFFCPTEKLFDNRSRNDIIKNQYALSHNIPLVRIPYTEKKNLTYDLLMSDKYLITEQTSSVNSEVMSYG